jgi:hypothetical protein
MAEANKDAGTTARTRPWWHTITTGITSSCMRGNHDNGKSVVVKHAPANTAPKTKASS